MLSPAKNFSSAGTITFTHAGSCAGGSDTLMLPSGTELTNSGTLSAVAGTVAGPEQIDGKVKSSGTVSVASGVTLIGGEDLTTPGSLTDLGTIAVGGGSTLTAGATMPRPRAGRSR